MSNKTIKSENDNIDVEYCHDFLTVEKANKYYNILERNLVYNSAEESMVVVAGNKYQIKRQQVAYGEPGTFYSFAGNKVYAKSWSDITKQECVVIKNIRLYVQKHTGKKFNFVLINRYADGMDKIGAHRDDEKELVNNPTIVGVSLGASRSVVFSPFKFVPKETDNRINLVLGHGSLFAINHPTNQHWKHEIPQDASVKKPRISLTFRNIII